MIRYQNPTPLRPTIQSFTTSARTETTTKFLITFYNRGGKSGANRYAGLSSSTHYNSTEFGAVYGKPAYKRGKSLHTESLQSDSHLLSVHVAK
ncbi:hypothetical protein CTI12_AA244390 [Artemisia annua]|uniref:Uncharacterized protein n=1 Tax=Artemisia annua TaxID=35608 RepID=A0A2U1NPC1_ARTAN|nr:hypothetical protein CTI12_AA244390 [Artemisia annua]